MYEANRDEQYEDAEILMDGIRAFRGPEQMSTRTVMQLLRFVLISDVGEQDKGAKRFAINETGRRYIEEGSKVLDEVQAVIDRARQKTMGTT